MMVPSISRDAGLIPLYFSLFAAMSASTSTPRVSASILGVSLFRARTVSTVATAAARAAAAAAATASRVAPAESTRSEGSRGSSQSSNRVSSERYASTNGSEGISSTTGIPLVGV